MISIYMHRQAFSLVELSIVLVILGLLVGGILAGQSLIRAAELRSVTTDYQRYVAATHAFRDKYFYLPGDIPNATAIWGTLGGTGSDTVCHNLAATGTTATCNGDGNGNMLLTIGTFTYVSEIYRYWQHLVNAGLVEGQYTGRGNGGIIIGTNVPPSRIANATFLPIGGPVHAAGLASNSTSSFFFNLNNIAFTFRTFVSGSNGLILAPEEAWNIDAKIDDGMPGTGSVIAHKGDGTISFCTTAAGILSDAGATYNFTVKSKDCYLFFNRVF